MMTGQEILLQVEQHQSGRLKAIDCNGITVRYSDEGTGQPFLFLHHGGASHAVWSGLRERIQNKGRTIAIDFPGFGESDKPRRSPNSTDLFRYDLAMLTETVDQVIRSLELERPILVGNCMGSAAALAYTLNFPDRVGGLLLCNVLTQATVETGALRKLLRIGGSIPGMRWLLARQYEWGAMPAPFQKWSINIQLSPGQRLSEGLQETFEHLYRQPCQNRVLNNMGVYLPTFGKLDHVSKPASLPPVWVIWGKHNRILPCDQGRAFCSQFNVDRLEVLESGHLPMVQCPEAVANLLCELSAQINPPARVQSRSLPPHPLREMAQRSPAATAVIEAPSARRPERSVDWRTLWQMANQLAWELQDAGIRATDRVLLLVTPSPEFLALSHALNMIGAAVVFVDGGLAPAAMASCVRQAKPTAFIGIPRAHLLRLIMPRALSSVRHYFSLARDPAPASIKLLAPAGGKLDVPFPAVEPSPESLAAIVFTSGSTGPPKGVEMSFRNFSAMMARSTEPIGDQYGGTALILYPLFLQIFSLMGRTSVLPDMDFSRPAAADPKHIVECIQRYKTTLGFSSPAILVRVAAYCKQHGISLDTMRAFFAAGAPIAYRQVIEPITSVMPNGHVITPYGATEALPVAAIDSDELRNDTAALTDRGAGICVGKPIEQVRVRIIPNDDNVIPTMENVEELPRGQVGEICVAGENVTLRYFYAPEQTRAAKIQDPHVPGGIWHRIGDLGYLDDQGRLWYCGRKKHRVECPDRTFYAQQPEGVADAVPGVFRSAFVGVKINGQVVPVLVVEPETKPPQTWASLARTIQEELDACNFPVQLEHILLHEDSFPVDPRHNAKIHREQLAEWASKQLGLNVSLKGMSWLQRGRGTSSWG